MEPQCVLNVFNEAQQARPFRRMKSSEILAQLTSFSILGPFSGPKLNFDIEIEISVPDLGGVREFLIVRGVFFSEFFSFWTGQACARRARRACVNFVQFSKIFEIN